MLGHDTPKNKRELIPAKEKTWWHKQQIDRYG